MPENENNQVRSMARELRETSDVDYGKDICHQERTPEARALDALQDAERELEGEGYDELARDVAELYQKVGNEVIGNDGE